MAPAGQLAWHRFAHLSEASEALAETVALRLSTQISEQGRALLAVPGGATPARFLAALGEHELDWSRVTLLPTDERFVSADDAASNEAMIRQNFAPLAQERAGFLSFHGHGSDIEAAAAVLCARLAEEPPLDLLVSGMGADGHVASLFPGAESAFAQAPDSGIVVARPPGLPPRLSLSPARLAGAGWAALLVSGAAKAAVLDAAAARSAPLPVDLLLARPQGLDVFWAKE
jgi:6-phosphogluconolactonase